MKLVKALSLAVIVLLMSSNTYAQFGIGGVGGSYKPVHTKVKGKGNASACKGQTLNVVFDYSNIMMHGHFGKVKSEADYVAKKKNDYNEKEPGRGDRWAAAWVNDRAARFEPSFITKFNQMCEKSGTKIERGNTSAKYTLMVKTTYTDPGYNVGVANEPAIINLEITIIDNSSKAVLATVTLTKCPGQTFGGFDFDTGVRLSEAYEKGAKEFCKFANKKFWK